MDYSPIKIAQWVGAKENALNHDNKNNQNKNKILIHLNNRSNLSGKRPHRPVANLPVATFRSQPREMLLLKPLNTYISVFLFEYWFSFPSRKVLTSLSVSDTDFSVLAAVISENSHKLPWIENGEGFAVHSSNLTEWCARRVTCQLLIGDNKYTWKNMVFFQVFCYRISRGRKSFYNTVVCMIN